MNNAKQLSIQLRTIFNTLDQNELKQILNDYPTNDIAIILSELVANNPNDYNLSAVLQLLNDEEQLVIYKNLTDEVQDLLLDTLPEKVVIHLFENLPSDLRADIFNRMNTEDQVKLLPSISKAERADILKFASYDEDTVGSVTTSDCVTLPPNLTAGEAITAVRSAAHEMETIYVIYIVDDSGHLTGTVSLKDLVTSDPSKKLAEIMKINPIFVRAESPKEEAAETIRHYNFLAIPVLNGNNRMIGIVTVDDAMDIAQEEDLSSLTTFGGTAAIAGGPDLDLMTSSFKSMYLTRGFWLAVLTFFGIITSTFVAGQEELLSEVIILAAFIAPIVDMGGNTGSQSATLVIRAMALGEIKNCWKDVLFVIKRELPLAAALGISIALLEAVLAYFSKGDSLLAGGGYTVLWVVGLSMLVVTSLGGLIGGLLPFLARSIGTDPATLSSPLITSIMDLLGVFIYFALAYLFLGDLLMAAAG